MRCDRHHVQHYGQCPNCIAEVTAQLGTYSNNLAAQQAPTLASIQKAVDEIKRARGLAAASDEIMGLLECSSCHFTYRVGAIHKCMMIETAPGLWGYPRTIAEARKASEVPRYFDKHGTEIFKGDHYRVWEGTLDGHWGQEKDANWSQEVASLVEVLSRADGTPVYRYKGGEDVRDDDFFRNQIGGEGVCRRGPWAKPPRITQEKIAEARNYWAGCTLIRRAGESAVAAHVRHEHREREELTRDWERFPVADVARTEAARALEVFADWCNQPTLAQRFDAFKRRVTDVLLGLREVTATFDFNQELGPFVVLRCKGILLESVYDERSEKQISQKLDSWARDLGWDILRGK